MIFISLFFSLVDIRLCDVLVVGTTGIIFSHSAAMCLSFGDRMLKLLLFLSCVCGGGERDPLFCFHSLNEVLLEFFASHSISSSRSEGGGFVGRGVRHPRKWFSVIV